MSKIENPENYIACCGCNCRTCKAFTSSSCLGCKIGYLNKERDINKAKCNIKVCCYKEKGLSTCADCDEFADCKIILSKFKNGSYDNKKCMETLKYIKDKGKEKFIINAIKWKGHWGKLD